MTQVLSCQICGKYICNDDLCTDCRYEIARQTLAGVPFDKESIKEAVLKERNERWRRESMKMLAALEESDGENNWRKYMMDAERLEQENLKLTKELQDLRGDMLIIDNYCRNNDILLEDMLETTEGGCHPECEFFKHSTCVLDECVWTDV